MIVVMILVNNFQLLQRTQKAYIEGNERIKYTTPALVTVSLKLARKLKAREHYDDNWNSQSSALYRFLHQMISTLNQRVNPGAAELCLRLFVSCGQVADQTGFEDISYEYFAQAFTIYEDSISDSRAQFQAVCILASALSQSRNFSRDNYDNLITKAALHGSKLLKKPDQCRAVYLASHLWWIVENPQREEDATTVSFALFAFAARLKVESLSNQITSRYTALQRWQTRSGMSPTRPPRRRRMHGHRRLRRTLCRNPQSLRLLL